MREIKFRAKIATTDSWVYGHYAFMDEYHVMYEEVSKPLIIKSNTLGQYTGLKDDVNDREIYEGDIMRAYNRLWEQHVTLKVHYLNGCFMFGNYNAHGFFKEHQNIEVIGNIFENPELLEVNK